MNSQANYDFKKRSNSINNYYSINNNENNNEFLKNLNFQNSNYQSQEMNNKTQLFNRNQQSFQIPINLTTDTKYLRNDLKRMNEILNKRFYY